MKMLEIVYINYKAVNILILGKLMVYKSHKAH